MKLLNTREKRRNLPLYVINTVLAIIYLLPLIWMFVSSFKPEANIFSDMSKGLQAFMFTDFTLDNYKEVFQRTLMPKYIFNSMFYVTILVFCSLVVNSLCGYALAKLKFRGSGLLLSVILSLMVLPLESIILSLFYIIAGFNWIDTYKALIIPFIAKCFDIYLFRQFFLDVPDELIEAAQIDGCGTIRIFTKVVVPNCFPVFATVLILDFVAYWSDFMWPLLVTTQKSMRTVQLGLQTFFAEPPVYYGPIMAALVLASLPMLIMFMFFQKYYVQGIATSGIKG